MNPNYPEINAAKEESDPLSMLHYTQQAIALHHAHLAFVYGDYKDLDPDNAQVYSFTRTLSVPGKPDQRFLVVLNFGPKPLNYELPEGVTAGRLVLANVTGTQEAGVTTLKLRAWDARVYTY